MFDLQPRFVALGALGCDCRLDLLDALLVAFARGYRQHVIQSAELGVDLFGEILLLAHEVGQCRIVGGRAGAGSGQRLLHRMAADEIGEAEGLLADRIGCTLSAG